MTLRRAHPPGSRGTAGTALVPAALLAALLFGCAGQSAHRSAMDLQAQGRLEEALAQFAAAAQAAPGNAVYQMAWRNARARLAAVRLAQAQRAREAGQWDEAQALCERVLAEEGGADATSAAARHAREALAALARERRHAEAVAEVAALVDRVDGDDRLDAGLQQRIRDSARRRLAEVLRENPAHAGALRLRTALDAEATRADQAFAQTPALAQALRTPVDLEFREASFAEVIESLARHAKINILLDKDVPATLQVTAQLRRTPLVDALDVLLMTHQLRRRVLNASTLLIYPDTSAKLGDHQELLVRTVYLANADARQAAAMLKNLVKLRAVHADERLNLLVIRDAPEAVRLAERLLAAQDVAEPEVMLEVAIVEVTRSSLETLGIQFPSQLSLTPLPASAGSTSGGTGTSASASTLTLQDLRDLDARHTGAALSPLVLNLQDDSGVTNLLANPRIRARNREKATIRIGDRVPVITTTATSTGFVSESVQYVDVGLKLEVEPVIYPGDEVLLKLALEVSSVTKEIVSKAGSVSYQIGGRNASTVLRVKDGETQVLGGLINDEDRRTAARLAGLSDLPVLGRLFRSETDNNSKTELVLSITPRVVRSLAPPAGVPGEYWSGTETSPGLRAADEAGLQ